MRTSTPIRLAIVEDEQLVNTLLEVFFNQQEATTVVFTGLTSQSLWDFLEHNPLAIDVLLVDLRLQDGDMTTAIERLQTLYPTLAIFILSSHYCPTSCRYFFDKGVSAFLPKDIPPLDLLQHIITVWQKGCYFLPEQLAALQQKSISPSTARPQLEQLTPREQDILLLICQQRTAQQMAQQLRLSKRTVENYKNKLFSKLAVKNTAGLILIAAKYGLVNMETLSIQSFP